MTSLTLDPRFKSDEIFNAINKHFITLKDDDMYQYNVHLKTVLDIVIEHMKKKDPLFKACYRRIAYVGSYYEGLKVGQAEEFDLDVIINLPIDYNKLTTIIASERPGYIKLKANSDVLPNLRKHVRWPEYNGRSNWHPDVGVGTARSYYSQTNVYNSYGVQSNSKYSSNQNYNSTKKSCTVYQRKRRFKKRIMDTWFDKNDHLDQNRFRNWFESVVTKALSSFQYVNGKYILEAKGKKYLLSHKKSGPAWTMKIDVPQGHTVDVDLVPALEFPTPPPKPFINHKTTKQNWFAISKPLDGPNNNILWRPSFYEREQEKLKGNIKQVIRQMKKLRDTQNFKSIASYYIKTLFLRELEERNADIQKLPPTFLFYHMLQKLRDACAVGSIYDFWNPKNNLLGNIGPIEMKNIRDRLNNIIAKIDKKITTDRYVIAEFILTTSELDTLKQSMQLPGKMSSLSVSNNNTVQQPNTSNGYLSTILNSFWRSQTTTPATQ